MKSSIYLAAVLALVTVGFTAQAQTKVAPRRAVSPKQKIVVKEGAETMKDGAVMKDGKVLFTQQGHTNPVTEPVSLINGTKIMADGSVTMADGSTAMLKEGDMLSLSGRLTTKAMKAEQDSLMMMAKSGKKAKMKIKNK
ncbi:hypothetical protein SAMN02745146_0773 [Hymenobacter daecheongensis DSM 21074]|uniref:DUF6799 domain-containing protein n=1 Tax=Hymenobacter daecheongensis DSM 21074 TaxID=1121955 RepID=A0A1M6AUW0_9BACT|nr:DUF6799 domain-containing protein [Hymenobacter daecheongensis]SHI40217.1 hypothetical protein SAMN02745146_0773 [Hymenobacter daecheongensis DSM 21074]